MERVGQVLMQFKCVNLHIQANVNNTFLLLYAAKFQVPEMCFFSPVHFLHMLFRVM